MPIPEPPGGVTTEFANDEGGRGMPPSNVGDSQNASPGADGGPESFPMDTGGRGMPTTGFGPGENPRSGSPGGAGGARNVANSQDVGLGSGRRR